jgi:hypothetical protein
MYDLYLHGKLIQVTDDPGQVRKSISYLFDGAHWEENFKSVFEEWDFVGDVDHEVLFYLIKE